MRKTNQKEKEDKEVETKAFDLSIISFGNGKQKSKANERSIKPEEKDNFEQTRFDFGKITFARGARNPFTKPKTKISKEDAALEQEIEASLSPPEDTKVNYEKRKSNVQPKVDDKKPDSSDQKANFKGVSDYAISIVLFYIFYTSRDATIAGDEFAGYLGPRGGRFFNKEGVLHSSQEDLC